STPSRANTKPARARRVRWEKAEITAQLESPAGVHGDNAAGHRLERHAAETRSADHARKFLWLRKTAGRLDEVAIGLSIAGHGAADLRNDIERIEVVETVERGHIDRRELQAEEVPTELQRTMDFAQRHVDLRHVADAEGDGDGVETLVGER